jgi:peptidylprolyl isomerase
MATTAKPGDTVAVHYTGKLTDGSVFDTSADRDPIQFVLGQRRVIPGFDQAITGMSPGEKKTAEIPAEDAYGPRRQELIVEFSREKIPPDISAEVGQELQVQTSAGEAIPAVVVETSDTAVTLDANHPLAGKDLTFDIELVELVDRG